ncbi:hypothetical protein JCM10213_004715 [Rhodosporidiobolus nylandii]
MPDRAAPADYAPLETQTPHTVYDGDSASDSDEDADATSGVGEKREEQDEGAGKEADGHAYEQPPAARAARWRSPVVLLAGLAALILTTAISAAFAHPSSRSAIHSSLTSAISSLSPSRPSSLPRVERDPHVSLSSYLHARFDPEKDVVMFTLATGSYIPQARNWDAKRAELGMRDSVVVVCMDEECLDEAEKSGLRAWGGYLEEYIGLPPPTTRRMRLSRRGRLEERGKERGHFMAYAKFKTMLEMAKTGFPSLFFEGDTFLTADPFAHMLPLSDPSWDLQFTEDIGYVVNFGWIFARPSPATIELYQLAFDRYCRKNEWDQQLLSNLIRSSGGREWAGKKGDQHWWLIDSIGLRLFMLPLTKFRATHTVMLEWYQPDPALPEPAMNHLTAFFFPNRQFYPKERGWHANVDSFYTRPRPILTSPPLVGTLREIVYESRVLQVVARKMGWALMVPGNVTVLPEEGSEGEAEGKTVEWSRVVSVEAAMTNNLDLLESSFFAHAARYLPSITYSAWTSPTNRLSVSLASASLNSTTALIAHLETLPAPAVGQDDFRVVELSGLREAGVAQWNLEDVDVEEAFKTVPSCALWDRPHLPFPYCKAVPI